MSAESISSSQGSNQSSSANLRSLNICRIPTSCFHSGNQSSKTIPSSDSSAMITDMMSPVQPIAMLGTLNHSNHMLLSGNNPDRWSTHSSYHHSNGGLKVPGSSIQNSHNHSSTHHHHHSSHHFQSVSTSHSLISNHESMRRGRYSCPICLKAFSEKGNMKRHTLIHLPQRHRYQCDLCSKGFSWKDNFNRHRRSHHL